jgi:hypothetical protein
MAHDRAAIAGYWELHFDGGEWRRSMDITLTKQDG